MAKKPETPEEKSPVGGKIIPQSISGEMRQAYLDYAMTVITSRALPDVRDGLKPVHRRILFTMHQMGLSSSARFRKSAAVVGDVLGKFHPHGDTAVYDALAKMAQDFTYRYPLIMGQGNFGSVDGDAPAAMRYTEAKMSKLSGELLRDLEKDTVEWRGNYDNTRKEPVVLPSAAPGLLLTGPLGIAVGMATNIPPHNLTEVSEATIHLIDNPDATTEDLVKFVKGPDFPSGCIAYDEKDILHAYTHGKGGVVIRGEAEVTEDSKGNFQIIITSIPYRVNKSDFIIKIADLVRDKKIEGIKGLRDESTRDTRVVIDLKGTAQPQTVLNYIYKHTQLEDTFHYNMVAIVDGIPQTLSLKNILECFVKHRKEVVVRRTKFELKKAEAREHILLGLKKALDHIDAIIKTIKKSKDAHEAHGALKKEFKFSDLQATAILEMRLQKLAGLERKKIEDELKAIQALIKELKKLLGSEQEIFAVVKRELEELVTTYGDERRTKIIKHGVKEFKAEDLIADEESMLVFTKGGYIKRTNPTEYKRQKRGGVGVVDLNTKEEDVVTKFLTTNTHSDLLFFTDKGKVYQLKMFDVPEGKRATRGKSIMNFLSISQEEHVTSILAMPKEIKKNALSLMMVTKEGVAKKVSAENFHDVRRSGLIAITLKGDDELISASFVRKGEDASVVTQAGQSIRFNESDIREMGRGASGVRAIKLSKGDKVIGAEVIHAEYKSPELLVLSSAGYGKKTSLKEYKTQNRGGSGIKTAKVTEKTGKLIAMAIVDSAEEIEEEVVAVSQKGQVIRTGIGEIPSLSRQTQGVRVMKLRAGDEVASMVVL
ncbi:MAG: DNA gyrase subunit A [Candidatus Paceibacterota bacterium]